MALPKTFMQFKAIHGKLVMHEQRIQWQYAKVHTELHRKCYKTHKYKWQKVKLKPISSYNRFLLNLYSTKIFYIINTNR